MRRRVGFLAWVASMLALWCSLPAASQDAAAPGPETPAKAGPAVIAAADITSRANADERFAQEVIERSRGQSPAATLEKRLDVLAASVREESAHFKKDEMKLLSIQRLERLARHWSFYGKQLEDWRRDLKQATAPYTEDVGR